jgi:hypothetical protein
MLERGHGVADRITDEHIQDDPVGVGSIATAW